MKQRITTILFTLLLWLPVSASTASDAEKAYRNGEYAEAEVMYETLLKNSPSNRIYNHRYGVCLCEQEKDLTKAEKHLLKSKKQGVNLSLFYLGKVCFLQYKFEDAMAHYSDYLAQSTDKEKKAEAQKQRLKCEQGKTLLSRTEAITFTNKADVDKTNFFLNFNITSEAGSYRNSAASIEEDSIAPGTPIYITGRGDRAFFSFREDSGQYDLYSKNRLLDQWSNKVSLGPNVNSSADEAYPFLMSDGMVLYFSSKGHNAFGKYDIFITRYSSAQNTYLPPQQLGMPFNSLGNDILLAIDEYNNIGWLASDRDSEEGKMTIYTFKPNETIKLLATDDEQALRNAAMLKDVNKSDTVATRFEEVEELTVSSAPKIYFIVYDTLIYTQYTDFMSKDAKALYAEYETAISDLETANKTVAEKRLEYSKTIDSQKKVALISEIKNLEKECAVLEEEKNKTLLGTRRLEQETIRANGGYHKQKPQHAEAPAIVAETETEHVSPWEKRAAKSKKVTKPFFYDKNLDAYYKQIYAPKAIAKLTEANELKAEAADKQFWADYIMHESSKPEPEENFFEKIFAYDTTLSAASSPSQIAGKANYNRHEAALMFVKSAYLNYYTLKGQNVILLESVSNDHYRKQMQGLMDRADFAYQQANQKAFTSEKVYTTNTESLAKSAMHLKEGVQMLEAVSLTYLRYRYDKQSEAIKAEKPKPVETATVDTATVDTATVDTITVKKTPLEPKANRPLPIENVTTPTRTETAQKNVATSKEYRIQFGTFSRILKAEDTQLSDISTYKVPEKLLFKHYTGHYNTPMEASMALEQVKAKGYKDAYVVMFVDGVPER